MQRAVAPLLEELAAVLEDVARALERRDADVAERALARARAIDPDPLQDAIAAGREMLQLAPFRARDARALRALRLRRGADRRRRSRPSRRWRARRCGRSSLGDNVPAPVPDAARELAEAVRTLDDYLEDPAGKPVVSEPAVRAAAHATLVLEQTANLSVSTIVVQMRAMAVDLLRGWGLSREDAERRVRETARSMATAEHESLA